MQEKKICLAQIQQADGSRKNRPVLVLRQMPNTDFLVCGLSTQIHQEIPNFDEIILPDKSNRLKQTSLIRLSFLASLAIDEFAGVIGEIPANLHHKLLKRLSDYLKEPLV